MTEAIALALQCGWSSALKSRNRFRSSGLISLRFIPPIMAALLILQIASPGNVSAQILARTATSEDEAATTPLHLSMNEAVQEALRSNPGLRAVEQQVQSAERSAAAAFRQHFGEIDAVAWGSHYQDDQILLPMSSQLLALGFDNMPFDRDQLHYGLTFELPLYIGGKLHANMKLARLKADEAKALLSGARWQVRFNVIAIYAANQAVDHAIDAYEEQVNTLDKTLEHLKLMVDSGKRPNVDLLKMVETLEEARAELANANADQVHARAMLAALLDRPIDQLFQLDPFPPQFPQAPAADVDWSNLLATSSTSRAAELRVGQAESSKHIARSEFLPKVSFRGNLLGHRAPSVVGAEETWELTVGVSLPIFAGGRRIAAYQSATARQRAAELAGAQTQRQLEVDLQSSLARLTASNSELSAAMKRVDASREAARIESIRYETGAGTIEDFLRAQTHATAAKAMLAKAEGDVLITAARINATVEKEVIR